MQLIITSSTTAKGQWEVVGGKSGGKNRQPHGDGVGRLTKNQKKKLVESMPKVEALEPLRESTTIYDAFREREEIEGTKEPAVRNKPRPQQQQPPGGQTQQQKKRKEVKKKGASSEDLLARLTGDEVAAVMDATRQRFPGSPIVWMKDLAAYLNGALENQAIQPAGPHLSGYPVKGLGLAAERQLLEAIESCQNKDILQLFLEHCVQNLLQGVTKNQPTLGYRLCLQLLASRYPELVVKGLPKLCELRTSYQNRQPACQALLWAALQAGLYNLSAGLKVWLELVLPMLGVRAFTVYVLDSLEALLMKHPVADAETSKVLGVRQLFPLLDLAYGRQGDGLAHAQQERLRDLYSQLKVLSYGDDLRNRSHFYFPSYLRRLVPRASEELRQELLESLLECLVVDPQCMVVWKQLYPRHLAQSRLLLEHLCETWESLPQASRMSLKETLPAMSRHNTTGQEQAGTEATAAAAACRALEQKMSRKRGFSPSAFQLILTLVSASGAAALAWDVWSHQGYFERSHTGKFLQEAGAPELCDGAKVRLWQAYQWVEANAPEYYSQAATVIGPRLENFQNALVEGSASAWEKSAWLRDWLCFYMHLVLQWVNGWVPVYLELFCVGLHEVWSVAGKTAVAGFSYVGAGLKVVYGWLLNNLLTGIWSPEQLSARAVQAAGVLQSYTRETAVAGFSYAGVGFSYASAGLKAVYGWLLDKLLIGIWSPERLSARLMQAAGILQGYAGAAFRWLVQQTAFLMGASPH